MSTDKVNILIVDDAPENRKLLASVIRKSTDYEISIAHDGQAVLDTIMKSESKEDMPDLILLDIMMPGVGGYEVSQALKKNEMTADIPIIFITALSGEKDKVRAFDSGGIDYITKPFNHKEILSRINAHVKVKKQYEQIKEYNEQMKRELSIARKIQEHFVHQEDISSEQLNVYCEYIPLQDISGDIFEVVKLKNNNYMIFIGDVTGHGLPAALYTMMLKSSFNSYSRRYLSPGTILTEMNSELCEVLLPDFFITSAVVMIDLKLMTMTYCTAAHPAPLFYYSRKNEIVELNSPNTMLGVMRGKKYRDDTIELSPGDRLLLYTDGITEMLNSEEKIWGKDRLKESMYTHLDQHGKKLMELILKDAQSYSATGEIQDDIAMIYAELKEKN